MSIKKGYRRDREKVEVRNLISQAKSEMLDEFRGIPEEMSSLNQDVGLGDAQNEPYSKPGHDRSEFDSGDDPCYKDWYKYDLADDISGVCHVEDTWKDGDCYNPEDRGVGYLRYFMESVKPKDVHLQDIGWVVEKYSILSAIVQGGLLSEAFFKNNDESLILGRYAVSLCDELRKEGIEFELYCGLTEKGWDTFRVKKNNVAS